MKRLQIYIYILLIAISTYSCDTKKKQKLDLNDWNKIVLEAKNQTVTIMMWLEDSFIRRYMTNYVAKKIKQKYDVKINFVDGQGNQIINTIMSELEANKKTSEVDMLWINGETFYQLKQMNALFGPFVNYLPNSKYINMENHFIAYDFQILIQGYECPWGNVQMTIIYNKDKLKQLPQSIQEFEKWARENPEKFTIPDNFTGLTLLKSWFISLVPEKEQLKGEFNPDVYNNYSKELWKMIKRMKPYLWNKGQSFPSKLSQMHRLFANGEIYFTLSNNDNEVNNKIAEGVFPENSRAYVPNSGSIQNSHYWGIPSNSKNIEAAMVICNFLISPEAQYEKNKINVWGDGTILDINKLDNNWKSKFDNLQNERIASPSRSELNKKALFELHAEYMIRLEKDFKKIIVEQ